LSHPNIDVNIQSNNGWTPLHRACYNKNTEIVKLLLEHSKINPNIKNNDARTPLYQAYYLGNFEIAKLLLESPYIKIDINNLNEFKKDSKFYSLVKNRKNNNFNKLNKILDTVED
jgi:ankyrin repeat protein